MPVWDSLYKVKLVGKNYIYKLSTSIGKSKLFIILDLIYSFEAMGDCNGKISKDVEIQHQCTSKCFGNLLVSLIQTPLKKTEVFPTVFKE